MSPHRVPGTECGFAGAEEPGGKESGAEVTLDPWGGARGGRGGRGFLLTLRSKGLLRRLSWGIVGVEKGGKVGPTAGTRWNLSIPFLPVQDELSP